MISRNTGETIESAQKFAKKLKGGETIGLIGDLGAGKTVFVKGLAEELGIKEAITSPTFVILKEYDILRPRPHLSGGGKGLKKLIHIDTYRVENIEDIKSVGIEDYFGRKDIIIVVEWAEKIKKLLPKNTIYINFKHIDKNSREISIFNRVSTYEVDNGFRGTK
ncbi:MAG: tRNA (adenosine(37)-N6)-threonylcarbamoyltransferase complex ATPase subunit type 1 TsaE [Patescibacteria group bacterium]|nr:tRNA (adenosine(37)-N6)-threonylcarbamoyltransferase complex ATPase subunit type 1 TsaE [Patescibacteria group bacterium]